MKKNITDKLNFSGNPYLVIKDTELEVNADATTILKVMGLVGDSDSMAPQAALKMYDTIFSAREQKKIEKMQLKMNDFNTLLSEAIDLIVGGTEDGGE